MNITYLIIPLIMLGLAACKALSYALFGLGVKRENHLQWFTSEIFSGRGNGLEDSKDSSQRKSLSTHTISSSAGLREVYQGILYFGLSSKRVTEKTADKKCKDLGHDTEEITIKLLAVLTQMDIDAMQKARRQQPNPDELGIIDEGLAAIKGFKASIGRMVTRNNLKTDYIRNVKNYPRFVRRLMTIIKSLLLAN